MRYTEPVRISIPLMSRHHVLAAADLFEQLANDLDVIAWDARLMCNHPGIRAAEPMKSTERPNQLLDEI